MNTGTFLIIWLLFCGILGFVFWFSMLNILESKGEKVNSYFVTFSQLLKFWKLIKAEPNKRLKKRYLFIFWGQIILIPIYIIGGFLIISKLA